MSLLQQAQPITVFFVLLCCCFNVTYAANWCSKTKVGGDSDCSLPLNDTIDFGATPNVFIEIDAKALSYFSSNIQVLSCYPSIDLPDCALDVLILTEENYEKITSKKLDYASLKDEPGVFLVTDKASATVMFRRGGLYYLMISHAQPTKQSVTYALTLDYYTPNSDSCLVAVFGTLLFGLLLILGLVMFVYMTRNKQQVDRWGYKKIDIPNDKLADSLYLQEHFRLPIATRRYLSCWTQPSTKFSYWLRQHHCYLWAIYPRSKEVLSRTQRLTIVLTYIAFNLLMQVFWNVSFVPTGPDVVNSTVHEPVGTSSGFVVEYVLWKVPFTWLVRLIFSYLYIELVSFVVSQHCCGKEYESLQVTERSSKFKRYTCYLTNFFSVIVLGIFLLTIVGGIGAVVHSYSCRDMVLHIILPFLLTEIWDAVFPGMLILLFAYCILNTCAKVDTEAFVGDYPEYPSGMIQETEDDVDDTIAP